MHSEISTVEESGRDVKARVGESSSVVLSVSKKPSKIEPQLAVFPFIIFVLIGTAELAPWNSLLNALSGAVTNVFEVTDYSDTVTATYSTVLFVLTLVFIRFNVAHVYTLYFGLFISIICALAFALTVSLSSPGSSSALMHTISSLAGLASATMGSSAFGFAAQFPYNYGGAVSAGLGVAGVVTFVVWMIGNHAIWTNDKEGTRCSVWLLMGVIIVVSVCAWIFTIILFRRPDVARMFAEKEKEKEEAQAAKEAAKNSSPATMADMEGRGESLVEQPAGTYETEGLKGVIRRSFVHAFGIFFTMYVTLICFPIVGPLNFHQSDINKDILTGVFQVFDLVGRYAPNYITAISIKKRWLLITLSLFRVVFVFLFIFSSRYSDKAVIGSFGLMFIEELLLALTNGWLVSCYFIRMPDVVEGDEAKIRVASIALLATFLGIAGGQWTGKGLVSIP